MWAGALLVIAGLALPALLAADPDDDYDESFDGGLIMTKPLVCAGVLVLLAATLAWAV